MRPEAAITSDMPDACHQCGAAWTAVECVHTGDDRALDGYEDWCWCRACGEDWFYPHRLKTAADIF